MNTNQELFIDGRILNDEIDGRIAIDDKIVNRCEHGDIHKRMLISLKDLVVFAPIDYNQLFPGKLAYW